MQFSPVSDYFILLRPKYLPQYPIFQNPRLMFFPHFDGDSSTWVEIKKIYSFCNLNLLLFWKLSADTPQIIDRMLKAGISRI